MINEETKAQIERMAKLHYNEPAFGDFANALYIKGATDVLERLDIDEETLRDAMMKFSYSEITADEAKQQILNAIKLKP